MKLSSVEMFGMVAIELESTFDEAYRYATSSLMYPDKKFLLRGAADTRPLSLSLFISLSLVRIC